MVKLIFAVTKEDADKIIWGLAELPYKISSALILELNRQATEQLNSKIDDRKYDDIANKKLTEAEEVE